MNRKQPLLPAILALALLSIIWGYNWVVMKECLKYATALDFAASRTLIGAVSLFILMIVMGKPLRPQEIRATTILALLNTTLCIGLVTWALSAGAVGKTAIIVYFMPFWVLIFAWPILGERIHGLQWPAGILAFAGLVIILEPWRMESSFLGKSLSVLSGMAWAASAIYTKMVYKKGRFDVISLTAWQMLIGCIPLVAAALIVPGRPIVWTAYFIGGTLYSSVVSQAAALLLWFYALHRLSAGVASMGTLATPVIGIIAASVELGERPTWYEGWGMVLILAGLALLSFYGLTIYRRIERPAARD